MSARHIAAVTMSILGVVAAFSVLYWAASALFTVLLAFVVATSVRPLLERCTARWHFLSRGLFAFLLLLGLGAMVAAGAALAVPVLADQADALLEALPALCRDARQWSQVGNGWAQRLMAISLPPSCAAPRLVDPALLAGVVNAGPASLLFLERAIVTTVMIAALAYAWLRERPAALEGLASCVSPAARPGIRGFVDEAERRIGGFVRGQVLVSGLVALATFVTYRLLGLPNALALAALAGFLEVIPIMGPLLSAAAGAGVAFTSVPHAIWGVFGLAVTLRLAVDYVVGPFIIGKSAGVNPFLVIVALVALAGVGGITGAMVAIPLAALLQLMGERWLFAEPAGESDRSSRLRYEVHTLVNTLRKSSLRRTRSLSTPEVDDEIEQCALGLLRHFDRQRTDRP